MEVLEWVGGMKGSGEVVREMCKSWKEVGGSRWRTVY